MAVKCVTGYNQLLQTNDILECQLGEIYTKADETKKRNMTVGLSIALNNLCNNGVFRKVVIKGVKGHFYGLPDWFEANGYGELKKEYLVKLIEKTKRQRYETVTMEKQYGDIIMASRNIFG